jgi:serine/threonine protein kinase
MGGDPFGLSGQIIDSQFRVDHPIGDGGFSVVYKGLHLGLDEWVAIKCLKLQSNLDTDMIESFAKRFKDESRIAYRLSQGNLDIVRSITAGTTVAKATGALLPYMVLEWLDGCSLASDFRERKQHGYMGRTLDEVIELFEPAALAIAYAHDQGVVHRDIKPGNLFLTRTRGGSTRLKVLDFGLAKIVGESELGIVPSVQTMGAHTIVCSPSYGAPEQFDPAVGMIGPWTDVYALGLVLLEALRDKRVRTGEGLAQCAVQALDAAQMPTCHALGIRVRPQVEVLLARAVAVDIATRPANARELWDLLKRAATRGVDSRRAPAAPPDAPPVELATVWDPRGAQVARTPQPMAPPSAIDPFNATALMLDAPQRPVVPATLPLAHSPTIPISYPPPPMRATPLERTAPMDQGPAPRGAHAQARSPSQANLQPQANVQAQALAQPLRSSRAPLVVLALFVVLALVAGVALVAYRFLLTR